MSSKECEECQARVSTKSVLSRVSSKSVKPDFPARFTQQECQERASSKSVQQECQARVSRKSVKKEFPIGMSSKNLMSWAVVLGGGLVCCLVWCCVVSWCVVWLGVLRGLVAVCCVVCCVLGVVGCCVGWCWIAVSLNANAWTTLIEKKEQAMYAKIVLLHSGSWVTFL